jgi:hypothetical protein
VGTIAPNQQPDFGGFISNTFVSYIHASSRRIEIRALKNEALHVNRYQRFSLEQLFPTPLSLLLMSEFVHDRIDSDVRRRLIAETGFDDKSAWRKHKWGVSSDVTDVFERKVDQNYWAFKFTTIGSYPDKAIQKLSEQYPLIDFTVRYFASDSSQAGDVKYRFGNVVRDSRWDATTYASLIVQLKGKGVVIDNEAGRLVVKYNSNFEGSVPRDEFSCIFGVTFDQPHSDDESFFTEFA